MPRFAAQMGSPAHPPPEPHEVLGVGRDATPEQIARAYRRQAKRLHPDRTGSDSALAMAELNAAYELLRDGLVAGQRARDPRAPEPAPDAPPPRPAAPGAWLDELTRRRLGPELTAALETGEQVLATADAATWDSHDVRMAVTDRRLLWLRDDAISDSVRYQRFTRIKGVEVRGRGRLRRTGELRITTDQGRRLRFGELAPEVAQGLLHVLRPLVFQPREQRA